MSNPATGGNRPLDFPSDGRWHEPNQLPGMGLDDDSTFMRIVPRQDAPSFDTDAEGQFFQELLLPGNEERRYLVMRDFYNNHPELRLYLREIMYLGFETWRKTQSNKTR